MCLVKHLEKEKREQTDLKWGPVKGQFKMVLHSEDKCIETGGFVPWEVYLVPLSTLGWPAEPQNLPRFTVRM